MIIGKLPMSDSVAILRNGNLGRLGCISESEPYVVPVNYFSDGENVYLHSLPGKKISALRSNPRACLQVDEIVDSYHWRSVIAYGTYEEISDEQMCERVLGELFRQVPNLTPVESRMTKGVLGTIVFCLRIDRITGIGEHW